MLILLPIQWTGNVLSLPFCFDVMLYSLESLITLSLSHLSIHTSLSCRSESYFSKSLVSTDS
jgi:hypothetical protein